MVCPKIDKICRDCCWNKRDSYKNGELDKCRHPNVFVKPEENEKAKETCYVSGRLSNEPKARHSEYCVHLRNTFDNEYHTPGVDICGKAGLWFESKPAKKWWQIWR
jgi:hypothetical protein